MPPTYLPQHLLKPFFDEKPIRFALTQTRMASDQEFSKGWLTLTVFGNGSCVLRVMNIVSSQPNTAQLQGRELSQGMLDHMRWNEGRKEFEAIWAPDDLA